MQLDVNKEDFWEERYLSSNTPWDINRAAPAFIKKNKEIKGKVAVLGCGKGHDAFYFAKSNCEVCGFDFSEGAIKFCNELKNEKNFNNINFHYVDFFDLIKKTEWKNYFDFMIEHTSLCAIDPSRRKEYSNLITYLLKPGGKLIGLFFMRPKELGGPPFGSTKEEIRELFKDNFIETEKLYHEACPHTFTGEEYFGVFEKIR